MLAFNFTKFLYLKIRLGFSPFGLESLKIIGLGIIAILLVDFIPETENPILNLLIKSGLIILIYFLAARIGFSGKEELNWLSKKLKKPGP